MDLHEYMHANKITEQVMAEKIGCSAGAVRKIRYGERKPSIKLATKIAKATGLTVAQLRPDLAAAFVPLPRDKTRAA